MRIFKNSNFYTSWFFYSIGVYLLLFLRYVFFIFRIYQNNNIIVWEYYFLYDNLKTTIAVCIPCFIMHWLFYKYGPEEYRK